MKKQLRLLLSTFCLSIYLPSAYAQDEGVITIDETVRGSQEQPKVLYIVPWKPAVDDTILDQTMETNLENIFRHVERVEHRRQVEFISDLESQSED